MASEQAHRLFPSNPGAWDAGTVDQATKIATIIREGTTRDLAGVNPACLEQALSEIHLQGPYQRLREWWRNYFERERMIRMREVLTAGHRAVLAAAAASIRSHGFRLVGGTALACAYLYHRESDDLDFFTVRPGVCRRALREFGAAAGRPLQVVREEEWDAEFLTGDKEKIRVHLVETDYPWLRPPGPDVEQMPVAAVEDLAAGKILALNARGDTKDLVDVFFLAREVMDLSEMIALAEQKQEPAFDRYRLVRDLVALTRRIDPAGVRLLRPLDFEEMRRFYEMAALRLLPAEFRWGDRGEG